MKLKFFLFFIVVGTFFTGFTLGNFITLTPVQKKPVVQERTRAYWFILYRKSNLEQLFFGTPGNTENSRLIKTFPVKTGVPGERPTPLPELAGREYWLITRKYESIENPETAPYFLELDIPGIETYPYGPTPYMECNGQCNWILPGAFGLHGVNKDVSRLFPENPGSSGCIRHTDEDITYLYNTLNTNQEIRYYIHDI